MEWYVYYYDFNAQKIIKWNIFEHAGFAKEVKDLLKSDITKEELSEKMKRELLYYMWAKCEYEVVLAPWTGKADDVKIDVYDQITMNWDRFVDYVWSFRKEK